MDARLTLHSREAVVAFSKIINQRPNTGARTILHIRFRGREWHGMLMVKIPSIALCIRRSNGGHACEENVFEIGKNVHS